MSPQATISAGAQEGGNLTVHLAGSWKLQSALPDLGDLPDRIGGEVTCIRFDSREVLDWDSALLAILLRLSRLATGKGVRVDPAGLPPGAASLLDLAVAVPEREGARRDGEDEGILAQVGDATLGASRDGIAALEFLGETTLSVGRLLRGRARFRGSDLASALRQVGVDALPIVSLISILVGLILAFVGAVQLQLFGAEIYVASLVGIAMVRVMAAIMTGIIMAGRTGAAFAAELGTTQVNEEVDALDTLGLSSFDFLVLPRLLAVTLMMPLLVIYADLMGIIGGFIVGVTMLDLSAGEYLTTTWESVGLANMAIGIVHGTVFGVIVGLTGCYQGIRCGRSASSVGSATTAAVVNGIVLIIGSTAVITVICNVLGV